MNERNLLATLKHDFIVNMKFSFQDRNTLYLVMDLFVGGDLRYHIGKKRKFSEKETSTNIILTIILLRILHCMYCACIGVLTQKQHNSS